MSGRLYHGAMSRYPHWIKTGRGSQKSASRSLEQMWRDRSFRSYCCDHNGVLLSGCWFENKCSCLVDGFKSFVIPRLKSKLVQRGGCIFFTLCEIYFDSVVWFKIDNCITFSNKPFYFLLYFFLFSFFFFFVFFKLCVRLYSASVLFIL